MTEKFIPGMRVGVFPTDLVDDNHAYHCGYGTYEGEFVPPVDIRYDEEHMDGPSDPNHRINLDSGQTVWGHECWFMSEEDFNGALEDARRLGKEVVLVEFKRKADVSPN